MTTFALALAAVAVSTVYATDYDVWVGVKGEYREPGNVYDPQWVPHATHGDRIIFHFEAGNHTVTQSSFATPCVRDEYGVRSGFRPVAQDGPTTFIYDVLDDSPVWFYCGQGRHCEDDGMVFAVNPGDRFDQFVQNAIHPPATEEPWYPPPAEETWYPTEPAWTPTYYDVQVGVDDANAAALLFTPPIVHANIGDIVRFNFHPKNHSATQSSFDHPCMALDHGFDAGFNPISADQIAAGTPLPVKEFHVSSTDPAWFYCKQPAGQHCKSGMVFALNADEASFAQFKQNAADSEGVPAPPTAPPANNNAAPTARRMLRRGLA